MISNMDAKYAGEFWKSLCNKLGIKRKMSTRYDTQTDGQTEELTRCWEVISVFSATTIRTTGTIYLTLPNSSTTTWQLLHN